MSLSGVLMRKGAAVTFRHIEPGTYDGSTDRSSGEYSLQVAGRAMQIDGNPDLYTVLGLIESDSPTLLFRPTTAGEMPGPGWTVSWGGQSMTVKNVTALAMAGIATAARIIVSGGGQVHGSQPVFTADDAASEATF